MLIKITYDLADPAGIMYFANTFHLAHKSIEHWLDNSFDLWSYWFNNSEFGVPIKHTKCDYFKPMIVGQNYTLQSKIKESKTSSLVIETQFLSEDNNIHAKVETVHVFVDKNKMEKMNIPDKIKNKLGLSS